MAVNGLAVALGRLYFGHHLLVTGQDSRKVHHFGQKTDVVACQQLLDIVAVERGATRLDVSAARWHARRGTKAKVEADVLAAVNHKLYALFAQHVANFVRVGHNAYGSLLHSHAGKFGRHHHAAFYVHMAVDESRQKIWGIGIHIITWRDVANHTVFYRQLAVKHAAGVHIQNMTFVFHLCMHQSCSPW